MRLVEPNGAASGRREFLLAVRIPAVGKSSTEQLTALVDRIQRTTREAQELALGRSYAHLNTRLEPNSWSVAECFGHLAQTTRAFLPAISDAVATAPNLTTSRPLRAGTFAWLFIRNLEPPYRLRYKVLAPLAPRQQNFGAAWDSFVESQFELSETVRSAAGLAIDRVKIKSPVYARIHYNVYGAFRILTAHQCRHLWQVQQIFKALDGRRSLNKLD
ncbi:MAG: DinB family protein [Candidatus Sulfotelmatobacter sp.]